MNRREILVAVVALPVAGAGALAILTGCQERSSTCVDFDDLGMSEESLRRSVNYVERSPDRQQTCSGCAFFTAGGSGESCGACELFDHGPVSSAGRCDSWAAA